MGYESRSPELAARVANDLVTLYLRENLETRKQLAAGSAEFLAGEAEKLRLRVAELEQRIAEFKQQNYDRLPEYAQVEHAAMNARHGRAARSGRAHPRARPADRVPRLAAGADQTPTPRPSRAAASA